MRRIPLTPDTVGPINFVRMRAEDGVTVSADMKDPEEIVLKYRFYRHKVYVYGIPTKEWPRHRYDQLNYLLNALELFDDDGVVECYHQRLAEAAQRAINTIFPRPEGFVECNWLFDRRQTNTRRIYGPERKPKRTAEHLPPDSGNSRHEAQDQAAQRA